jgi:hypothetical protein
MKRLDFIVIPAAAISVMVPNVAISFGVVWLYSTFLDPGRPASYYEAFAIRVAPISSVVAGIPLMFVAGFLIAKGRPNRGGMVVAAGMAVFYIILDSAALLGVGAGPGVWKWAALSHATKLLAALAGARLRMIRSALQVSG